MKKNLLITAAILFLATGISFSQWQYVGDEDFIAGDNPNLIIDAQDNLILGYRSSFMAQVVKQNGDTWDPLVTDFASGINYLEMVMDGNGNIYSSIKRSSAYGAKFDGTNMNYLGATLSSSSNNPRIALDNNDVPYIAYKNSVWNSTTREWTYLGLNVKKFDGTNWVFVGNETIDQMGSWHDMNINSSGVPYVIYNDEDQSNGVSVVKFNGTSWEYVGGAGITTTSFESPEMEFDASDVPYIAYREGAQGYVKKFNGTSWEAVGSGAATPGSCMDIDLKFAPDGTLYLAYNDISNGVKASMLEFDGTNWIDVGDRGFSTTRADYLDLNFTSDGTPYLLYINASGWTLNLMTYIPQKENQDISFVSLDAKSYGDADFQLGATASSELSVTYTSSNTDVATVSGSTVTIVNAGTTTITASQAGNENYNPADDVQQALSVDKAALTITADDATKIYGESNPTFSMQFTGFVGNDVESDIAQLPALSCDADETTGAGTADIVLTGGSDENYNLSLQNGTLTINKADQTITFDDIATKYTNSEPFALSAHSTSALTIEYTTSDTEVATISGDMLTVVGAGTSTITANQPGNENYEAATPISTTLSVMVPVGIATERINQVTIYPNPARDLIYLAGGFTNYSMLTISIFDLTGKLVSEQRSVSGNTINISNLTVGIYLMRMKTDDTAKVVRFIKE